MNLLSFVSLFRRQPSELAVVREQVEIAEAKNRLASLRLQSSTMESSNGPPWLNPWWDPLYRWHQPTDAPVIRDEYANRECQTLEQLAQVRGFGRELARSNPFGKGAMEALENFLVGDGMEYTASTSDDAAEPLVAAVQDVWDEFSERTLWPEWEQEIVRRWRRDGEVFLRLFPDSPSSGYLDVRIIEPDWVVDPLNERALDHEGNEVYWSHGIGCKHEDRQTPVCYWVVYPGDEDGSPICASEIIHLKANVDRNVPRGLSDFFCTGESLNNVVKLLRNSAIGESVRAAIVGFWEYENATATDVSAHLAALKDRLQPHGNVPNPVTGKTDNCQHVAPGSFINTPASKKFIGPPDSADVASQVQTVDACLRAVASAWQMPEFIWSNANNAPYAAILVAGSPFVKQIRKEQGRLKPRFSIVAWLVIRCAANAGRIVVDGNAYHYADVERQIEMQIEAPTPELSNEGEQASVDQGDMDRGVLSKQTRRMRRGLDDEQEAANIKADPITPPSAPGQPAPGQGQFPPASGANVNESVQRIDYAAAAKAFLEAKGKQ